MSTTEFSSGTSPAPSSSTSNEPMPHATLISSPVVSEAMTTLALSAYPELKHIVCEYDQGKLILRGRVGTYYMKQMAQELLRQLDGVDDIDNAVSVVARAKYPK